MTEMARKFTNPTPGYVGANKYGPDGRPTAVAVPPGHDVWLTAAEERLTAEAPRQAKDNPFVKAWRRAIEWDGEGNPIAWEDATGVLVPSDEGPRPIASERFTHAQAAELADAGLPATRPEPSADQPPADPAEILASEETEQPQAPAEEITGAPPLPEQPPVEGQPAPNEVVATPEAVAANDEFLAGQQKGEAAPNPTHAAPLPAAPPTAPSSAPPLAAGAGQAA